MKIYLKMISCCYECPFCVVYAGAAGCKEVDKKLNIEEVENKNGIPKWCPLPDSKNIVMSEKKNDI